MTKIKICGVRLPKGLREASKLPAPIFTPASKAPAGTHDENITFSKMERKIGRALAAKVREITLQLYSAAAEYAQTKGILIADTKFEFGLDADGALYLIDEALTPDSSRFWPSNLYAVDMSASSRSRRLQSRFTSHRSERIPTVLSITSRMLPYLR